MNARARVLRAATALAALVALLLAAATAEAAVDSAVTLKIGQSGAQFKGKVTSAVDACFVGRKVLLIRIEPGGSKTKVAKTFTSESGRYAATIPMQAGNKFFAKLKGYEAPTGTLCRGAKSRVVTV